MLFNWHEFLTSVAGHYALAVFLGVISACVYVALYRFLSQRDWRESIKPLFWAMLMGPAGFVSGYDTEGNAFLIKIAIPFFVQALVYLGTIQFIGRVTSRKARAFT